MSLQYLDGKTFSLYPSLALGGDGGVFSWNFIPNSLSTHAALMKKVITQLAWKKMHYMI